MREQISRSFRPPAALAYRPDLLVARARFRGSMRARSLCPPGRHAGGAVASEVTSAPIAPVPTSPVPNLHAIVEKCREDKKRVGVGYARGMRVTLRRRRPGAMRRCRWRRRTRILAAKGGHHGDLGVHTAGVRERETDHIKQGRRQSRAEHEAFYAFRSNLIIFLTFNIVTFSLAPNKRIRYTWCSCEHTCASIHMRDNTHPYDIRGQPNARLLVQPSTVILPLDMFPSPPASAQSIPRV